ncbi:MAG: hypothetical protein JNL67_08495 [Planctomycetaceae bacterium]|nr:hypothetical protein [Planctomycetaceae bacterium]
MTFDPMPDGHVNRDVQILVEDRRVTVDVRMAATDLTWIEIIGLAEQSSKGNSEQTSKTDHVAATDADLQETKTADGSPIAAPQPAPKTEAEVPVWLQQAANRKILERWFAAHCQAQWGDETVLAMESISSRSDSLHHWAVVFQVKYKIPPGADARLLRWRQTPFVEYPGKVRRAIKTRGDSMIDSTDVSPLVVRAEFEMKTAEDSPDSREEVIEAKLRLTEN